MSDGGGPALLPLLASEMSLRDAFAAKAMAALIAKAQWADLSAPLAVQWTASSAYKMADAMLAERAREQ